MVRPAPVTAAECEVARAAARLAETDLWRRSGAKTPEEDLARRTGATRVGDAEPVPVPWAA